MNIFVVDTDPFEAARLLPDKHVVKMPLETAQMLSIVCSKWYRNWGPIHRKDGTPYATERGAFRNHPCTVWVAENDKNLLWLILHGRGLCAEYTERYNKKHSSESAIIESGEYFCSNVDDWITTKDPTGFARAMPDYLKNDTSISDVEAYRAYLNTKTWVAGNYLRIPERKPSWVVDKMS